MARRAGQAISWRTTRPLIRQILLRYGRPAIWELRATSAHPVQVTESEMLRLWFPDADVEQLRGEFGVDAHHEGGAAEVDRSWDLGDRSAFLLYALVRLTRPATVLETGVARGVSSTAILAALAANGHGVLHSTDIGPNVGSVVPSRLRSRWHLHVLDGARAPDAFLDLLATLPTVDLFLHDSDHSYGHMTTELRAVHEHLSAEGWLVVDDADASYAVRDLARTGGIAPVYLFDDRKMLAVIPPVSRTGEHR